MYVYLCVYVCVCVFVSICLSICVNINRHTENDILITIHIINNR